MKKKPFIFLLLNLFFVNSLPLMAQQDEDCLADHFFEKYDVCNVENHGIKCLELDVSGSLDPQGKNYKYQWVMGDGNRYEGLNVSHCYEEYGSYFITLNLVDIENGFIIRNELSKKITLWPPMNIEYKVDTVRLNMTTFEYDVSYLPGVTVDNIFWKIEDTHYCGKRLRHTFSKKGLHVVEVGVIGMSKNQEDLIGCTLRGIYIEPETP